MLGRAAAVGEGCGGGEKLQRCRSERPWEDCEASNPTSSQRKTSGNFPAHLSTGACAAATSLVREEIKHAQC